MHTFSPQHGVAYNRIRTALGAVDSELLFQADLFILSYLFV